MGVAGVGPAGAAYGEEQAESSARTTMTLARDGWCNDKRATVHFHVGAGITLGRPAIVKNSDTYTLDALTDADDRNAGYVTTYSECAFMVGGEVEVAWPILTGSGGATTGHSLTCRTYGYLSAGYPGADSKCSVRGADGKDRFHVSLSNRFLKLIWDVRLTDGDVDRRAEASGSISADGSVSLDATPYFPATAYTTESQLRVNGADVVPAGSSTQFDAVLTPSDLAPPKKPKEPDTARMTFKYAIRDAGEPDRSIPRFYVRGDVSNYRGPTLFRGGSSCEIVNHLDEPVENSGYSCTMNGYHASTGIPDGRVHYVTDFTVGKSR